MARSSFLRLPDLPTLALLVAAVAAPATSATFARHVGQQDPASQGWTASAGSPPAGVSAGPVAPGPDDPAAWFVNDASTAGGSTFTYAVSPATPAGLAAGWTLRARLRVFAPGDAEDASIFLELADGSRRFALSFGSQPDGALIVDFWGHGTATLPPAVPGATGYHLVELAGDPFAGLADLYVDGQLVLANGVGIAGTLDRLVFGGAQSSSTGHGRYALVELLTGPQACRDGVDNDGDGLVDFAGGDPDCASPQDPHEESAFDSDFDGVSDADEALAGSDPLRPDSDGDGLGDAFELAHGLDPLTADDPAGDPDGDGLDQAAEAAAGSDPGLADTDGDGLSDGDEVSVHGSDPTLADSDGDGLPDGSEVAAGTNPALADSDGDGLPDDVEPGLGTDPSLADTDGDGLSDGSEVNAAGTDPLDADSDDDGSSDAAEVLTHDSDPLLWDTDGDGLSDGFEVAAGLDPLTPGEQGLDPDGDGLTHLQEQAAGSDPWLADGDGDGLSDGDEVNVHGSDPMLADTDGDGLSDGYEVASGLDPLLASDAAADPDVDGLTSLREFQLGTAPLLPDSDGDGVPDGDEVNILGTDPLDSASSGVTVGVSSALTFASQDQPLFSSLATPPWVIPIVDESSSGTAGQIVQVDQQVPLWKAQEIWDDALAQCTGTVVVRNEPPDACKTTGAPNSTYSTLRVSPTESECISGTANIASRSLTCCTFAGIPDSDSMHNGCQFPGGEDTFTVATLNGFPGVSIPTSISVGPGLGPRPTQPPPPQGFDVGAEVTHAVDVSGDISVTLDLEDGGLVDLEYQTRAWLRSDRSTVAAGDTFTLEALHDPDAGASSMSSQWPAASFIADYTFDISARVDVDYASIDPSTGEQGYFSATVLDEHLVETGELIGMRTGLFEGFEMRFMNGVPYAPDGYRDVFWEIPPLPVGLGIDFGFTTPPSCPTLLLEPICSFADAPITSTLAGIRFQIPDLESPAGPDYDGGVVELGSNTPVEPARGVIEADGSLLNSMPSRYRPATNFTDDTNLLEQVFTDQTSLSADAIRAEIDVDGLMSLASGGAFLLGANLSDPKSLLDLSVDILDSDAVFWNHFDQELRFHPNLVADVSFDVAVDYFDETLQDFVTLPAGQVITLAVRPVGGSVPAALAALPATLQVRQPAGGVQVSVDYSFRNNVFSNETYPLWTLAWQNTFLQVSIDGKIWDAMEEFGAPLTFAAFRSTFSATEPFAEARRGGDDPFVGVAGDTFTGGSFAVLDLAADADRDGLSDALEAVTCSSAQDADSDDDGLSDGLEDANRNGLVDAGETSPCLADSDGDGRQDGTERGLLTSVADPDGAGPLLGTDAAVFVPATDPGVTSDPLDANSPAPVVPAMGPELQMLLAFGLGLVGAVVSRRPSARTARAAR
ncbi:MAG: hypothetical protein ACQGVC_00265 [Myxococcota bacterium]